MSKLWPFFDVEMNDDVRKEYIKSKTFKENEERKRKFEFRKEKERQEKEEARIYTKTKSGKAIIFLTVFCGLYAVSAAQNGWRIISVLALIQTIYAILIGIRVVKNKSKNEYRRWVSLGLIMIVPVILLLGLKMNSQFGSQSKEINWGDYELASKIPKIGKEKTVSINEETDEMLSVEIPFSDEEEFASYIKRCKKMGYVIDKRQSSYGYSTYNKDGYKVAL